MRKNLPYFALIAFLLGLDQASKWLIAQHVPLYEIRKVIPGFFNLTHVHNKGAIFGFFSHPANTSAFLILTAASLAAMALVIFYFIKTPAGERGTKLALSLILAGALGNLVDRLARGYVIDFLDLHIRSRHWPFFNVADSCITIGAVLLFVMFIVRKPACSPSSSESAR